MKKGLWLAAVVLLLALGLVPVLAAPTNSDLAWYQHMAARWLEGADLYRDLVEVNPPLIVWLNAPPAAAARATGASISVAYVVWVAGLCALSLGVARSSSWPTGEDRGGDLPFLALFVTTLVAIPGAMFVFGQREHLMLVLAFPYLLLAADRLRGEGGEGSRRPNDEVSFGRPGRGPRTAAGVMAGLGFALKPHFLLLFLAVELLVGWKSPGRWRLGREAVVALGTILAYGIAVMVLVPDALEVARRLGPLYAGLAQMDVLAFLSRWETMYAVAGLGAWGVYARSGATGGLAPVAAVVVVAGLCVALLQGMGWSYHLYPAVGGATLLFGLAVAGRPASESESAGPVSLAGGTFLALVLLWAGTVAWRAATSDIGGEGRMDEMATVIRDRAPGERLVVFSPQIGSAFPLVNRTGARWGMRYPSLWILTVTAGGGSSPGSHAHRVREAVVSDLTRDPPGLILVDTAEIRETFGESGFDYMEFFSGEEAFAKLMEEYARIGSRAGYVIYERRPGS